MIIAVNAGRVSEGGRRIWTAPPGNPPLLKRLESIARPLADRLPALAAGELRNKLSRAGDPGNLTPAGFQAVRYGLAALLAIGMLMWAKLDITRQ